MLHGCYMDATWYSRKPTTRILATSSKQRKPVTMVGERRAWPSCLFSRLQQLLSRLQQLQDFPDKIEMVAMSFLIFSCWTEKDNIWDRCSGSVLYSTSSFNVSRIFCRMDAEKHPADNISDIYRMVAMGLPLSRGKIIGVLL